jgi:hypothetical protein
MQPDNSLAENAFVLAAPGKVYAVYLPVGGTTPLRVAEGRYSVEWYNPRQGGALAAGSVREIAGPGAVALGRPPGNTSGDWAIVVRRR